MLNAQQILSEGLLKLEHTKGKSSQVGFDLTLKQVNLIGHNLDTKHDGKFPDAWTTRKIGKVLKDKTELTNYTPYALINLDGVTGWLLYKGVYDITFNEGCKLPANRVAFIKQRSSLYRNGTIINSPVFDPGFETEFMGTLMYVHETIFIEENARVAQIYFHECEPAELYDGQWQGDKQRTQQ
jgi:deoxycytidine triphosphate deaminase